MPGPKKKPQSNKPKKESPEVPEEKTKNPSNRLQISVSVPSLSGLDPAIAERVIAEVKNSVFNTMNDAELQRSLEKWVKDNHTEDKIQERDFTLLKAVITEYLDSYILLGYAPSGNRVIIHHANSHKDRDAVMEFLKNIFIQQQQTNFLDLDIDEEDDEL